MYVMGARRRIPEKLLLGYAHPEMAYASDEHHPVGAIALLAINFDPVMATAC